ncbi:type IV pilus modification protein PilV [Moraxella oblonga]|uniref:type IV pilus modification protein PilV n=1 Tax=Moraxella oblonga TaxID=200413 RepID=UPI00082EA7A0|nr:type IV pilus modification protein PilV [Moraxella oblonga]
MKNSQQGVGLIEVIVALVILAVAVLGFSAMQLRAVTTSTEASNNVYATNIARDLAERLRVNRQGLEALQKTNFNVAAKPRDCGKNVCNATQMAQYDFDQVRTRATNLGMQMAVLTCAGSTLARSCVYVSWGDTNPTNGNDNNPDGGMDCTNGTVYNTNAQCVIMEIYNRV